MISDPHFESDSFPERPKILFIGIGGSSHTVSWIDLLSQARLNVRLFAMPDYGLPPQGWDVRTYLPMQILPEGLDPRWRSCIYPTPEETRAAAEAERLRVEAARARAEELRQALQASWLLRVVYHLQNGIVIKPYESSLLNNLKHSLLGIVASPVTFLMKTFGLSWKGADILFSEDNTNKMTVFATPPADECLIFSEGDADKMEVFVALPADECTIPHEISVPPSPEEWLAKIVREWRPDIIHTLGLTHDQGGLYYYRVRQNYNLSGIGRWVLQLRGGSDLTLNRYDPVIAPNLAQALADCDQIVSDNVVNADYVAAMGVPRDKIASISPVPGTGGIEIEAIRKTWTLLPSQRERLILWPKAYDCIWSLALPVFEALRIAWERIRPCRIVMLCMTTETTKMWFETLPEEIRKSTKVYERIPRHEALDFMRQARVMLAPSLVDGIPNVLYEAMACGAFPVVSPIETISRVVVNEQNCLLARNLFPEEIAHAIICAMNNDALVDETALRNLGLVEKLADCNVIGPRVAAYYESLWLDSQKRIQCL